MIIFAPLLKKMRSILFVFLAALGLALNSCKYQKLLKSTDFNLKYDMAVKYYEKKDYSRALPLFEELLNIYKGTSKAQDIYYYFAMSNYGLDDYALASYHFKNYTSTFPTSPRTEECAFMGAYCYYMDSPSYKLDPTNTETAITELQLFINRYPQSTRIGECNELMDKLRAKLQTKDFETAKLYYRVQNYKAAIVAFKNLAKDFPESPRREECAFLELKSRYLLAINSIDEKKEERLESTRQSYLAFIDAHPKSIYLSDAEKFYSVSIKESEKLKNRLKS
jgi:outer membrane protein assembly factor BamD